LIVFIFATCWDVLLMTEKVVYSLSTPVQLDIGGTPPILVKGSRDPSVRSQRHFSILIST